MYDSIIDTSSLVLHVLAATAMVGGGIVQVMAGARVRSATTAHDLAQWAGFTRAGGLVVAVAAAVSLLTGGHLAGAVWGGDRGGFENPFITLGMVGLLLLAPIGPMIGGARLRRLVEAARSAGGGELGTDARERARASALWGPIHSLPGVAVGLVWLMTVKPGWGLGIAGLLVTFAAGWVVGAWAARRPAAAPVGA